MKKLREKLDINDGGFVFIAHDDGNTHSNQYHKVGSQTLERWCKIVGGLINVPELHAHDFRHTGATLLKNRGMALEDISTLLNHKSTDVTNKFYIKVNKKQISKNKDRFNL